MFIYKQALSTFSMETNNPDSRKRAYVFFAGNEGEKVLWRVFRKAASVGTVGFLAMCALFLAVGLSACSSGDDNTIPSMQVAITPDNGFYHVTINYAAGDRYLIGREYGLKVLAAVPDYEELTDFYLKELQALSAPVTDLGIPWTEGAIPFAVMIERAQAIRSRIDPLYLQELDGFASTLSGGSHDELGDGKLSQNEYLILNLVPDIATSTACSTLPGTKGQFGALNAVVYSVSGSKHVVSFGWLGVLGNLVAINENGVFIANLYSAVGEPYSAVGRRSILFDIRKAMETCSTLDEVADFLKDPSKLYGYNHNMFLANATTAKVLENNFNRNRALRSSDSVLNPGIEWGFDEAVASVNSFLLLGNDDNHTPVPVNTERWANYKMMLAAQGESVDFDGMKSIITYHKPGAGGDDNGDIYGNVSVQAIVYSFADNRLELWVHPHSGEFDDQPELVSVTMPFTP
jgi:hypothetical protein